MKVKYVVGFTLLLLCGLVFLDGCKSSEIKEDVALKNIIIETVQKSKEIDFTKITNFEWDKMYVFTPYSMPKAILNKDGISISNSEFNIEILDTINMIGFVKSDKLVAFVELPRNYGGVDLTNYIKFRKEETKFNISQDKRAILFKKD